MAVPEFQSIMLPLLKITADGREHRLNEVIESLAQHFSLSNAERKEKITSGQSRFYNRVVWARTYLKKAGLVESTGRAVFRITERGLKVLNSNPERIDIAFLKQFDEFIEFQGTTSVGAAAEKKLVSLQNDGGDVSGQTPEEILEASYQDLRRELSQELLDRIKKCSPGFFEGLVVDLLVAMGYGGSRRDAGEAVGQSGDDGIDGIIKEDKLGLDVVYIQAKRWQGTVGRPIVQGFAGSLEGQRARKGVLITTSQFSQDAREYVRRIEKKIVLIDGQELAQLMIDYGVGVTEVAQYTVKRVDLDYFGDE